MPRKVTAWACSRGCGRRVTTHYDDMLRHEREFCFLNPERRACQTCGNQRREEMDGPGEETYWSAWRCGVRPHEGPDDGTPDGKRVPRYDCPTWIPKADDRPE